MRLLVFTVAFPGEAGGVQNVVRRLVPAARAAGDEATLAWAIEHASVREDEATLRIEPADVAVARWRWNRRNHALLRRLRPDVVNVHFASPHVDWFLRQRLHYGYRLVLSVHGSDVFRPADGNALARRLAAADAVTAVTPTLVEAVLAVPGVVAERVTLIPNGVDAAFWSDVERHDDGRTLVAVGRLHEVKGFDLLIEAVRRVPEARLTLIGDGPERAALERQAAASEGRVTLLGPLPPEDIRKQFTTAAGYALSSRSEGMPIALLEAMAAGLASVATRVGGVPDVLGDAGLLVPAEQVDALAGGIRQLLKGERATMARHARDIASNYAADRSDSAYLRVFNNVCHRP
jgi:glycosyltransferase involved in cell wall biosynthesis